MSTITITRQTTEYRQWLGLTAANARMPEKQYETVTVECADCIICGEPIVDEVACITTIPKLRIKEARVCSSCCLGYMQSEGWPSAAYIDRQRQFHSTKGNADSITAYKRRMGIEDQE